MEANTRQKNESDDISSIVIATDNPEWQEQLKLCQEEKNRKKLAAAKTRKKKQPLKPQRRTD